MREKSFALLVFWSSLAAACASDVDEMEADEAAESDLDSPEERRLPFPWWWPWLRPPGTHGPDAGKPDAAVIDAGSTSPDAGHPVEHPSDAGTTTPDAATPRAAINWETDEFDLEPGKERYLCFTKTLEEDVVIDGYTTVGKPYVHHMLFAKSRVPAEVGVRECNQAFDSTWDPIFAAGAGTAEIDFPKGAGHKLAKGTQLVVQLHLLNFESTPVKGKVAIEMRKSSTVDPIPVVNYYWGNPLVNLPPKQISSLRSDCTVPSTVKLIAGLPHMHTLGKSMRVEVGSSESTLKEVFKRDPFSFHNQKIDPLNLEIPAGSLTRVTCEWNNTTDQTVKYGESTRDEMCYFIGFTLATPGACVPVLPPGVPEQ